MTAFNEKNFSFTTCEKSHKKSLLKNDNKIKFAKQTSFKLISDVEICNKIKHLKVLDKIVLLVNILSNLSLIFFMSEIINGLYFTNAVNYDFTTVRIIGIIVFIVAQISGLYLGVRLFIEQSLRVKLLIVSIPLTILLVLGLWIIYNLDKIQINENISAMQLIGITSNGDLYISFPYIVLALLLYIFLLYGLYSLILKKRQKKTNFL
jgi:hypothetical protein